jgi:hypothetical protein
MQSRVLIILLFIAALAGGIVVVSAQEEDVRGAFLDSRPKTTNVNGPSRRRRRPPAKNANVAANISVGVNVETNANSIAANRNSPKKVLPAIGLGYTLFMREPSGRALRTDPTRQFRNGDRVRLALEPSVDGYIYIFDDDGSGPPKMIFPDARLDGGNNWVEAHVPIEIPSSEETEERLRWFEFFGPPGNDRIYIVVTREPLPIVPIGDDLVAFCGTNKDKCPWAIPANAWTQVENASKAQVRVATTNNFGQAQTERERISMTRGLGLDKSIPPPSVIRINASSDQPTLVTVLDLIHK